jgi:hypothetical protein
MQTPSNGPSTPPRRKHSQRQTEVWIGRIEMEARAGIELIKYNYIFQYDKLGSLRSTINLTITLGFHLGSILNDGIERLLPRFAGRSGAEMLGFPHSSQRAHFTL